MPETIGRADLVVCGWRNHRILKTNDRDRHMPRRLKDAGIEACCLGHTQDGQPKQLYVARATLLVNLQWPLEAIA